MPKISGLDVKREIIEKRPRDGERLALLSGFTRVAFSLFKRGGSIDLWLDCQSAPVREYIASLMMEQFKITPIPSSAVLPTGLIGDGAEVDRTLTDKLVFADCEKLLKALYVIKPDGSLFDVGGIDERFFSDAAWYARGVFLGSGSLSVPNADSAMDKKSVGYHLEFSLPSGLEQDFMRLLGRYGIAAHEALRADKHVVYIKDGESVSDGLALLGAEKAVLGLNDAIAAFAVKKDVNRIVNCELANLGRTVEAAVGVTDAIEIIEKRDGLDVLDGKLRAAADARIKYPQMPIGRLAAELGISKSGLKHRFDKIIEIAAHGADRQDRR